MYIGHFVVAELFLHIDPTLPVLPIVAGVAYPDIVWSVLVFFNTEKVRVDPKNQLQSTVEFTSYPYSHSLVRSGLLTIIPSILVALLYQRPIVGVFFFLAALSHWFLDAVVHLKDLPIFGFGKDKKIGFGLWKLPAVAFFTEYLFFCIGTWLWVVPNHVFAMLVAGTIFQLLNANAFFRITKTNPTPTPKRYAALALFGFSLAILVFATILR